MKRTVWEVSLLLRISFLVCYLKPESYKLLDGGMRVLPSECTGIYRYNMFQPLTLEASADVKLTTRNLE